MASAATSPPTAAPAAWRDTASALRRRVAGGAVACGCAALLGVAWWLDPAPAGIGTHQALGMPACGWVQGMGIPCPSCGMTTAFAHAADGHLLSALVVQPAGAMLALATAVAMLLGAHVAMTGAATHVLLAQLWRRWMAWAGVAIIVLAWGWKILVLKGVV